MVDLKNNAAYDNDGLLELLGCAMYMPKRKKTSLALTGYRANPCVRILGHNDDGAVSGVIVLLIDKNITILNIGVAVAGRNRGVGRAMIGFVAQAYAGRTIEAETDAESVGFYRRMGFSFTGLGERYPGVERFLCVLVPSVP